MTMFDLFLERIESKANTLKPRRAVLTVFAAMFFAVGCLVGWVVRFAWAVIAWSWAASVVGFRTARTSKGS